VVRVRVHPPSYMCLPAVDANMPENDVPEHSVVQRGGRRRQRTATLAPAQVAIELGDGERLASLRLHPVVST